MARVPGDHVTEHAPPDQRQVFLTGVQRNSIFFTTVIFLPALVLAAGALVWWNRR